MISFVAPNISDSLRALEGEFGSTELGFFLIFINTLACLMLLIYFAEKHKSIVFAKRKIIVLRQLLGVRYGRIQWVMPTDRIEGAHNPYDIKMFTGWMQYNNFPAVAVISYIAMMNFLILNRFSDSIREELLYISDKFPIYFFEIANVPFYAIIVIFTSFIGYFSYRSKLFDHHENWISFIAIKLGFILRYPVLFDIQYKIYRLRLAVYEAERMGIDIDKFQEITLFIEDRRFHRHCGVDMRAIIAAIYRRATRGTRSGGSTISQQLVRSIFVKSLNSTWRRKLLEIPMAIWIERCFSKNDIFRMYITSVRYEFNVIGIVDAVRYFFPEKPLHRNRNFNLEDSEIFFLVERLSNIKSDFLASKVQDIASQLRAANILTEHDLREIAYVYGDQVRASRVRPADEDAWGRFHRWASSGGVVDVR